MASDYRAKAAHGVALGSLTVLSPQPTSGGIKTTVRSYATSGAVYEAAPYAELVYSYIETEAEYQALLTLLGLTSVLYAPVTVYLRKDNFAYARYNATAVRPQIGQEANWSNFYLRDVVFLFKGLVAL